MAGSGALRSNPTPDPNFPYLSSQRSGILHDQGSDAQGNPISKGILLGNRLKSLITGRNPSADLGARVSADSSPYPRRCDPNSPGIGLALSPGGAVVVRPPQSSEMP